MIAGKCLYRLAIYALVVLWTFETKAQNGPNPVVMQTLDELDKISSYGDYNSFDSAAKHEIQFGINVCKEFLNLESDSIIRSLFFYHKGRLEFVKKEYETAKKDLEQSLYLNISNYHALERLCVLSWGHLKNYTLRKFLINSSIENWKQRCYYDSLNAFHWYYLAKTFELQNQYSGVTNATQIKNSYKRAIELDSNNGTYLFEYALTLPDSDRLPYLKRALSKEENWLYRSHIIWWYGHKKLYVPLLPLLNESIQLYETMPDQYAFFLSQMYLLKADILKSKGDMEGYKACKEKQHYYDSK